MSIPPVWCRAVRPRYIIKNPVATILFIVLTFVGAFVAEPKLIATLSSLAGARALSTTTLGIISVGAMLVLFALIYLTLQLRYVLRAQALAAALLFLALSIGAALLGYGARMRIAPSQGVPEHALSPAAYTPHEALLVLILLTATGTTFTAVHNIVFLRKGDYTEFGARRRDLIAWVTDAASRFNAGVRLGRTDAAAAVQASGAALAALDKSAAADERRYREFLQKELRPALEELAAFIADPQAQRMPDLVPRACGLIASVGPLSRERVAQLSAAFRVVRESR